MKEHIISRLQGKTADVTGGGSGISFGAAQRFIEEGTFVYIFGRRRETLDAAVAQLGSSARAIQGSVTDLSDLDRLYETVKTELGGLDILLANAGTGAFSPLGEITSEHYDQIFDLNVKGLVFTVQKALPLMSKGASIILTGSSTGVMGTPAFSIYSATKAAVRNLAQLGARPARYRHPRQCDVARTNHNAAGSGGVRLRRYGCDRGDDGDGPHGRCVGDGSGCRVSGVLGLSFMTGGEVFVDGGLAQV